MKLYEIDYYCMFIRLKVKYIYIYIFIYMKFKILEIFIDKLKQYTQGNSSNQTETLP